MKRLGKNDPLILPVDQIRALSEAYLTAISLCIEKFKEELPRVPLVDQEWVGDKRRGW